MRLRLHLGGLEHGLWIWLQSSQKGWRLQRHSQDYLFAQAVEHQYGAHNI